MNIILKKDSRLFPYQTTFGSTETFDDTVELDAPFTVDEIEPIGSVACTCYSANKVKSAETGKEYDPVWLWTQLVQSGKATSAGASPQDAFSIAIKGQKVVPTGEIDTSVAYFRVDSGDADPFTNVKSAIQLEYTTGKKRPVACGTKWYVEYNNTFPNGVLRMGITPNSAHEWIIVGWDSTHPNMFKIDAHQGYYLYMPQDVFNHAMTDTYGAVALTIAETTQEEINILKAINVPWYLQALDLAYNTLIRLGVIISTLYGKLVAKN